MSFLEPLNPEFQLQLSPIMMSGALAETITKPVIMRLLRNAVFSVRANPGCAIADGGSTSQSEPCSAGLTASGRMQTLFVWPNRLVVGMGSAEAVQQVAPMLRPRIKGLLGLTIERAVGLSMPYAPR